MLICIKLGDIYFAKAECFIFGIVKQNLELYLLASQTKHAELLLFVQLAFVLLVSKTGHPATINKRRIAAEQLASRCASKRQVVVVVVALLKRVQPLGDLLGPATIDELGDVERRTTMRTLIALFGEPTRYARETAQLRAVRTQARVL